MASKNTLFLSTRKGLVVCTRRPAGWAVAGSHFDGIPVTFAYEDERHGAWWACLDHGHWGVKLHRSYDRGASWQEVSAPAYPEWAEVKEGVPAATKYIWSLQPGGVGHPNRLWVGTIPGGLFRSEDGGATWSLDEALWALRKEHAWQGGGRGEAGIHSICFDPRDARHAYVGISCAGVLETKDDGASWSYVNKGLVNVFDPGSTTDYGHDPHCVVIAPSKPDVLWQANHCGVFKSADGAATWQNLTQKPWIDFGFTVAVHPTNHDRAWLVPLKSDEVRTTVDGRLAVARTDDGGATWDLFREGFPSPAYDFPFRHALDVGADGDTLALATTSGNLYVSEDGGVTWATVSTSLPPVYSVRFA